MVILKNIFDGESYKADLIVILTANE